MSAETQTRVRGSGPETGVRPDITANPRFQAAMQETRVALDMVTFTPNRSAFQIVPPLFVMREGKFTFPGLSPRVAPLYGKESGPNYAKLSSGEAAAALFLQKEIAHAVETGVDNAVIE